MEERKKSRIWIIPAIAIAAVVIALAAVLFQGRERSFADVAGFDIREASDVTLTDCYGADIPLDEGQAQELLALIWDARCRNTGAGFHTSTYARLRFYVGYGLRDIILTQGQIYYSGSDTVYAVTSGGEEIESYITGLAQGAAAI